MSHSRTRRIQQDATPLIRTRPTLRLPLLSQDTGTATFQKEAPQ